MTDKEYLQEHITSLATTIRNLSLVIDKVGQGEIWRKRSVELNLISKQLYIWLQDL